MHYYSTHHQTSPVSFKAAVIKGLPADNGLFMPEIIPSLPSDFIKNLSQYSLGEIGYRVLKPFVEEEIPDDLLRSIVADALNFSIPLVHVHDNTYSLELFHGPTLAFKDVGARFLARCLNHFCEKEAHPVTVLVATSGDTGSAVAHGFYGMDHVNVVILYPKGKVSELQERQMTTLGGNITAIEIDGDFDDCQRLVKMAFLDETLNQKLRLTSANSINIARLLPQTIYYFWAIAQLDHPRDVFFSVPSGNYGSLSAGVLAKAMGLPVKGFIACANRNDTLPVYLSSGKFEPKASVQTISNAMDVGNPSNFGRLQALYDGSLSKMRQDISGYSFTDDATQQAIYAGYETHGYTLDPHGAVGYLGLQAYLREYPTTTGIFLETAHPAKFKEVVEPVIGEVAIPERLAVHLGKEKQAISLPKGFEDLKGVLMGRY